MFNRFKTSNRSHASLQSQPQEQGGQDSPPVDSPLPSPRLHQQGGAPRFHEEQQLPPHPDDQQYQYHYQESFDQPDPNRQLQQANFLRRSQSQRSPQIGYAQPTVVVPQRGAAEPIVETSYNPPPANTQSQQPVEPPKKSKRRFFAGLGHSQSSRESNRASVVEPSHLQPGTSQLGRKVSVRRRDNQQLAARHGQAQAAEQDSPTDSTQYWQPSAQSSTSQLQAPGENAHNDLDPFLQTQDESPLSPVDGHIQHQTLQLNPAEGQQYLGNHQHNNIDPRYHHPREEDLEYDSPQQGAAFDPLMRNSHLQTTDPSGQYQAYRRPSSSGSANVPPELINPYQDPSAQQGGSSQPYSGQPQPPGYQAYNPQPQTQNQRVSVQGAAPQQGHAAMAPPPAVDGKLRRSQETQQSNGQGQPRDGPGLVSYGQRGQIQMQQSQPPTPNASGYPPPPPPGQQNQAYQGGPPQQQQQQQQQGQSGVSELGRSTPPLGRGPNDSNIDITTVLQDKETLQAKYSKVKKLYFEKNSQVEQLQNTLANQRLSQSRTSLDDSEYSNRFGRLDGNIKNLAFHIRTEWKAVPPWLQPYVNQDAHIKGTKEMTAVGRAAISRWIVDEILDCHFHPGLDPSFSTQLKIVEKNLRRYAPPTHSTEEEDALMAKIANWRLTTLDGLHESLTSPQAQENKIKLTNHLAEKLTASLQMNLKEPSPPGLEESVRMIVESAVGIAANLPTESRDVCVVYFLPGTPINLDHMKVETGLPPLTNPGTGVEGPESEKTFNPETESQLSDQRDQGDNDSASIKEQGKKKGMIGNLMGHGHAHGNNHKKTASGQPTETMQKAGSQVSLPPPPPQQPGTQGQGSIREGMQDIQRVRMAAFLAVEIRGKLILMKAPVWAT